MTTQDVVDAFARSGNSTLSSLDARDVENLWIFDGAGFSIDSKGFLTSNSDFAISVSMAGFACFMLSAAFICVSLKAC